MVLENREQAVEWARKAIRASLEAKPTSKK
jgi:hypothetical protein